MLPNRLISTLTILSLLTGCAVGPTQFAAQKDRLSPLDICRARASAIEKNNAQYLSNIDEELRRRGISTGDCTGIVSDGNKTAAAAAIAIIGILAIAAAARSGGGGSSYQSTGINDYDWAWDEFYNEYASLVWACRGKQTGRFAEADQCAYKLKVDTTWPSKRAP